ncbi:hypothetical protein [Paenibacillus agricola]|uniref:Lipoprotein n=1 Tax=Paenibacillus agricola TaxID=2716264 RepID=A0ABX0JA38_9BACL|nr:hypothetical protein [Paenibacillus agricola]NHN32798.1 hypothetical protein [Paenibacillus agricola]
MKKVVNGILVLSMVGVMTACGTQNEVAVKTANMPVVQSAKAEVKEPVKQPVKNKFEIQREQDLIKFNAYVAVMMDSMSFVKSATWVDNVISIEFLDYSEYKGELSEDEFTAKWSKNDRVRTILMEWTLLLLREFPDLLIVRMTTPLIDGKKLFFGLFKPTAEEIYGFKFKELDADQTGQLWKTIAATLFTKENRDYLEQNYFRDLTKKPIQ